VKRRILSLAVAVGVMALLPWPALAAGTNHDTFQFLAGTGGVNPPKGPDVATAPNGSTVSLVGSGTFQAGPENTGIGSGTFTIKDATGEPVASGAFTINGVLGFVDYGSGAAQGFPGSFGGEAKFHATFAGVGDGVLTVTCLLGNPPAGKDEGITLVLGNGMNFTKSTSGQTDFIAH
jgi:hypothetical protein